MLVLTSAALAVIFEYSFIIMTFTWDETSIMEMSLLLGWTQLQDELYYFSPERMINFTDIFQVRDREYLVDTVSLEHQSEGWILFENTQH